MDISKFKNIFFTTDSRNVTENSLFIAYKGAKFDGHDYIESAIKNGAKYIAGEKQLQEFEFLKNYPKIEYFQVQNGRELYAELCAQRYDFPQNKLKIIGVTGTDGKTTTSTFIYNILKSAGKKTGLISTVAAYYNDKDISTGLHTTTPDADLLFKIMKDMVDDGVEYLVLEITSHALIQKRVHGIKLLASVVTNVTPEHLDAHGTYEQLIRDKSLIFDMSQSVFLNRGSIGFHEIRKYVSSEIYLVEIDYKKKSSILDTSFSKEFPGEYNLQNAALAIAVGEFLGFTKTQILKGIQSTKPPAGRFERIENNKGINLIVDFAHTENAMRNVLLAVKKFKKESEKLIVVFGCAGERDKQKRSKMGRTSAELSDIVILTAEDPRSEKVESIIEEISLGNVNYKYFKVPDRNQAIKKSLELASKGDWVLILGKGHEQSMNFNGVEFPWSDIESARSIFNA